MDPMLLPEDFKEFLSLLNEQGVKYLLIGGYAVGYHGFPRTTADMDVWVSVDAENARAVYEVLHQFGIHDPELTEASIREPGNILRMGVPPMRIEILNDIDGVDFETCYASKQDAVIDSIPVQVISLSDLRKNKQASGRYKDLEDLEHLPKPGEPKR